MAEKCPKCSEYISFSTLGKCPRCEYDFGHEIKPDKEEEKAFLNIKNKEETNE